MERDTNVLKRKQAAAFSTLGHRLSSATTQKEAARIVADIADSLLGWDACYLQTYSDDYRTIMPVFNVDTVNGRRREVPLANTRLEPSALDREIIQHGARLVLRDKPAFTDSSLIPFGDTQRPSASLMFVPIRHGARVIGILSIQSYTLDAYDEAGLAALQALADHCGGALERIAAEEALRESEERFRQMADNIDEVFWMSDLDRKHIIYLSPAYEKVWQRSGAQLQANPASFLDSVLSEDRPQVQAYFERQTRQACEIEYRIVRPDGQIRWIRDRAFPIRDRSGNIYRVAGLAEDITERRLVEERLKASLREKELLLKEIHHRVKNNLQIISCLLSMQSAYVKDPAALAVVQDSRDRVKSMALIHETLYQAPDLSKIDFGVYVRKLMNYLLHSFGRTAAGIHSTVRIENIYLGIDVAIPCGLLLHELVSNSLKHGFAGRDSGEITVDMRKEPASNRPDRYRLVLGDDGVGFPPAVDFRRTASLGMQLVTSLVEDLGGTIELDASRGTRFTICFEDRQETSHHKE